MVAREIDPSILRQYDIRGVVNDTLTPQCVRAVGRAFGSIVARDGGKTVAVGYDGRLTSPELEAALVEGLVACGLTVRRIGRGPSPMLYYAAVTLETDAGMMITGSHNPPEFNGIKMSRRNTSFFGPDIQKLGEIAAAGDYVSGEGEVIDTPVMEEYVARLLQDYRGERAFKVAWDPGNGAAGDALRLLTDKLPGEHVVINGEVDGNFPAHHPDPTEEKNLVQLQDVVRAEKCDLGIAFDGDGDRIGVVDGQGRVLWGDQLLVLLAEEVLKDEPGATIIADVKASQVFFDEIERMGGKPLMWCTGHSLIKTKMQETKSPLAGEMSAHIFFKHRYYGFDDALYAAVRLLSLLSESGESLDARRDRLPNLINTPELRFDCPDDRKFTVIDEVQQRLDGQNGIRVNDIDGVRVNNDDGWWLLRASNTQPVLVARCEAADEAGLERLKAILIDQIRASGLEPPPEMA